MAEVIHITPDLEMGHGSSPVISHLAFNFISGYYSIRSIVDFNPNKQQIPFQSPGKANRFYPKCQACFGSVTCLEAKSGLEDLALHWPPHAPLPGPTLQGRSATAPSSLHRWYHSAGGQWGTGGLQRH